MTLDWGDLRRTTPFSANYGFDRGHPICRYYIDRFLEQHAEDIRGEVLEVEDATFTEWLGGERVSTSHVLDIDPQNAGATIVADIADAGSLPARRFDCFILTQTLQYVPRVEAALANAWEAVAPGGVLLITVPTIAPRDDHWPDLWRFTREGLRALVERCCPAAEVELTGYGSALTAIAYVMGLASNELDEAELDAHDPHLEILACARVRRPTT